MELSSLLTDTRTINDGAWIRVNEALFGDLEIKSRGFTDEFVDAQAARQQRLRVELTLGAADPIPNAKMRGLNAGLLRDFLVLDVKNLTDKGQPVTVEAFHGMLANPEAAALMRACWDAAAKVSVRKAAADQDAVGN